MTKSEVLASERLMRFGFWHRLAEYEAWQQRPCVLVPAYSQGPYPQLCVTHCNREYADGLCYEAWRFMADRAAELTRLGPVLMFASPMTCTHSPVTVQPHVYDRLGRLAQICRCCGSFRRRIGCMWGQWELSAPDVAAVRFPWPASPRVAEVREYPDGAAMRLVEVER